MLPYHIGLTITLLGCVVAILWVLSGIDDTLRKILEELRRATEK